VGINVFLLIKIKTASQNGTVFMPISFYCIINSAMKDMIKDILAIGAAIGLSDREAFVARVSGMISEYQHDPAVADKWANIFTQYIENKKDDYRMQKVIESSLAHSDMPDKENIDKLIRAIEQLTEVLQQKGGK
jgi:hypothetical protein